MSVVKLGIIGVGGIAQGVHIRELLDVKEAKIIAICDTNPATLEKVGNELNIPTEKRYTDYRELVDDAEVEAVEICTPNYLHVEMAAYAIRAGKHVNVEKPISTDCTTLQPLEDALKECNQDEQVCMSCFSYRFRPAVRYAKSLIEQGVLGQVVNVSVEYLKDSAFWKNRPMEWRFEKEKAGTGVLGDLGVHLIDMTRLLVGDFDSLTGHTEIIVKERPWADGSGIGQVGTDDFCTFVASMKNGATANFTISRCAIGEENSIRFDVYGTKGVLSFDLNNPDVLGVCVIDDDPKLAKMEQVEVPKEYHVLQEQSFVDAISGRKVAYFPDIYEAIECQKILDAVQESSEKKVWVKVH